MGSDRKTKTQHRERMPPSGSPSTSQALHHSNPNLSKPLSSSFSKPKYHPTTTQKNSVENDGTKPQRSSYVAKKKKSKKKFQGQGNQESLSISNTNENSSNTVAAHVLDQALENSLKNQRQKNRRRPISHSFSQQRKDSEHVKEENKSVSGALNVSKTPALDELSKKYQRKPHKQKKGTTVASNSLSSVDTSSNPKKSIAKSMKSQSKSDISKLPFTDKEKDNRSMQSNNSSKSLTTSSNRRKHNRSKYKASMSGDSSSKNANKVNNLGAKDDEDQGNETCKTAAPKTHKGRASHPPSNGIQAPGNSISNTNRLKDGFSKKKKYHYVSKKSNIVTIQNNENANKDSHTSSRHISSPSRTLTSSQQDDRNSTNPKESTQRQPRRSRFFQKKASHRNMTQKRTKSGQGHPDDEPCNQKTGPQHSISHSRSQVIEEKSPETEGTNQIGRIPQSLEVKPSESKVGEMESVDKTLSNIVCSKNDDNVHNDNTIAKQDDNEQCLAHELNEMKIQHEIDRENQSSNEDIKSEMVPTTRISRSSSNHSTISSMENITTTSMTTNTTNFSENARPNGSMMAPNFYGNSNMLFYDEFYPYQPESYPNSQSACMIPPNHSFNDQGMIPYGVNMSYPTPYQHPMNGPLPIIPPQEYNNFNLHQGPNNYGPTPADDRNDMMGLCYQTSENKKDNSCRVPFHTNESEIQPFPLDFNQRMHPNTLVNSIENTANENESSMSKDAMENKGDTGFIPHSNVVMPSLPPNMPIFPPHISPFSGGAHPQYFGIPPQPPFFMDHPLQYQPNMGMVHPHQPALQYPHQNFMTKSSNESKDEYDNGIDDSNVQASVSQPIDQSQNGYSRQ